MNHSDKKTVGADQFYNLVEIDQGFLTPLSFFQLSAPLLCSLWLHLISAQYPPTAQIALDPYRQQHSQCGLVDVYILHQLLHQTSAFLSSSTEKASGDVMSDREKSYQIAPGPERLCNSANLKNNMWLYQIWVIFLDGVSKSVWYESMFCTVASNNLSLKLIHGRLKINWLKLNAIRSQIACCLYKHIELVCNAVADIAVYPFSIRKKLLPVFLLLHLLLPY